MPSLAISSSSTGMFGRLTGKRPATAEAPEGGAARSLSPPPDLPAHNERSLAVNGSNHKRDSSLLSISSVTEIGHNVKRSVSLRSHRSNPSVSSTTFSHRRGTSSSGIQFNSTNLTTSVEDEDEPQSSLPPLRPAQTSPPPPRSRGKLSVSARSLSSKFKSSESLSAFSTLSDSVDGTIHERPTTAVDVRKVPSYSSMLAPAVPTRAPPERPPTLKSQPSFASDSAPAPSVQPYGLYMQSTATPVANTSTDNPKAVYQQIHETSAKRMATIDYMRKMHDGNIFYFGTFHYSPASLHSIPSMHPLRLGRRATNYLVLGYSLPAVLDTNSSTPLEYLRALTALLQEFETYQNLMGVDSSGNSLSKGRVGKMFNIGGRASKGRRSSTAENSLAIQQLDTLALPKSAGIEAVSPLEMSPSPISPSGHDFQHLVTPHLPFDPDFSTIYATLCDTLIDTYAKLMDLVSNLDLCTPALSDAFIKVDKSIRKILVANIVREFEDSTRAAVKGEVAGLGKLVLGGLM